MERTCGICKRLLDSPDDRTTRDCGGDCLRCMAEAGDPDCRVTMARLTEIRDMRDMVNAIDSNRMDSGHAGGVSWAKARMLHALEQLEIAVP